MRDSTIGVIALTLVAVTVMAMMFAITNVESWEARNHYPYGRMCDPNVFNFYQSSCR